MLEFIEQELARHVVIPVIAIENTQAAIALTDALLEGGLPVVEITFRTSVAAEVIQTICRDRPNMVVGAGTILSVENLELAKRCGAKFGVAPGTNPQVVKRAAELRLPFVPGVATPSEIEHALALGCRCLKFFPAEAAGGAAMLAALSAPYQHTGVKFIPTGGVNPKNLADYLSLDTVIAVGGTWLAKKEDIAAGQWPQIRTRCREAAELVHKIRATNPVRTAAPTPGRDRGT